ncbi:hypothetical protein H4Q26_017885, partial [Puccinia striiformis f. sp. tritici PST-130]
MPGPNQVKWGNGSHYCVITLTANQPHPLPKTPHPPSGRLLPSEPVEAVFGRGFPFVASSQRFSEAPLESLLRNHQVSIRLTANLAAYLSLSCLDLTSQVGNGSHYCVITLTAESTPSSAEDTSSSLLARLLPSEPVEAVFGRGFPLVASSH